MPDICMVGGCSFYLVSPLSDQTSSQLLTLNHATCKISYHNYLRLKYKVYEQMVIAKEEKKYPKDQMNSKNTYPIKQGGAGTKQ